MRVEKAVRMLYGRFFYRFPNGESAADVYDRITGTIRTTFICVFFFLLPWKFPSSSFSFVTEIKKTKTQTGFRETLKSDIDVGRFQPPGQRNPNMNLVLVSHGLTLRVFLMRWYKWTVEQYERLNNLGNGKMIVMEKGFGGR